MVEQFDIEPCTPAHASVIRSLIQELADFENYPDGPKLTANNIEEDLKNNLFFGYIASKHKNDASENVQYVGHCLCYYGYSSWRGKIIFLEDLYVKPEYRKLGIGTKLLKCVLQRCVTEKLARIHWNVLNWNKSAIEYYKRIGAHDLYESDGLLQFRMNVEDAEKFCHS